MTKARVNADNASADIQGVTAGDGLTGGGSSGTVTLAASSDVLRTTGGQVISANTSANALEIRQVGAGNAFVVEDSTNPDASPFTIAADGKVSIGNTTAPSGVTLTSESLLVSTDVGGGHQIVARKSFDGAGNAANIVMARSRGTNASPVALQNNDTIGNVLFMAFDGTNYLQGAAIYALVSGTPGTNDVPTTLIFNTTSDGASSPTERMRIDSTGRVQLPAGGVLDAPLTQNQQTGTTYTVVLADAGKLVELNNASAITLTVPTNASVAYPTGTQINLLQTGAGQVTVAGTSGVTVNATPGLKLRAQWSSATLIKRATDTWVLIGDLSA
jgi:hypothetical protein